MRNSATTLALVVLAILAFAGNSLLARAALADGAIDAGAFSAIRLASGSLVLFWLTGARPRRKDVPGAVSLAVYVGGFSLAYLSLGAGAGALILFACVQVTIIAIGYWNGEGLSRAGWIGLALAMLGLTILLLPGQLAVAVWPAMLMALAGIAWGVYTVIGRGSGAAKESTTRNFLLATPMVLPMLLLDSFIPSWQGVGLAIVAGALTSGLGYVVWYTVAPKLRLGTVASVQLATPVVAALGGVLLLSEPFDLRMAAGAGLILAGIVLTMIKPRASASTDKT